MVFCTKCGLQNEDTSQTCVKCGTSLQPVPGAISSVSGSTSANNIPNYLVQAILCTVCCCMPLGIPAVVHASQVNAWLSGGNIDKAKEMSQKAKKWSWIAFGGGALWWIAYITLVALGVMAPLLNK